MQLKHILCTLFALGIVGAAHAADDIITGGDGTCNETVLGTSENLATANTIATWSLNEYDCPAGQYLLVDGDNIACTPCASGSYCPGGIFTVESENKGTNICPTDYTSDEGASSESACYTQCELACVQTACPQNASGECVYEGTSVPGQEFYGLQGVCMTEGARFCSIDFTCKNGYTKVTSSWTEISTQLAKANNDENARAMFGYCDPVPDSVFETICSNNIDDTEFTVRFFDTETKALYVASIELVHFEDVTALNFMLNSYAGTTVSGELPLESTRYWNSIAARPYRFAKITEQKLLEYATKNNMTLDAVIDGFLNGTLDVRPLTVKMPNGVPWALAATPTEDRRVFDVINDNGMSFGIIMESIALPVLMEPEQMSKLYGEIPYSSCDANKIGIDWNPDDGSENIAGMCYYGGDVNIPEYVPTKPGYTFKGWKLVTE